jgi:hypothetical protein
MARTSPPRPGRARRLASATLALALVTLGAGGIIVFGPAESAAAAAITIDNPIEPVDITDNVWLFDGSANPNEKLTVRVVTAPKGPVCHTQADGAGHWTCNVQFPFSGTNISVQAINPNHTGGGQSEETQEYDVAIPPTVDENTDGGFVSTEGIDPTITGTAAPNAAVEGFINGTACNAIADGAGVYSCEATGANLPGDGSYPVTVEQQPPLVGFPSQDQVSTYVLDTSTFIPDSTLPYDTAGPGDNVFTSDRTPRISGGPGTAEGQAEVTVYAYQFSANGTSPGWPVPPFDPGPFYCLAHTKDDGSWACSGSTPQPINSVWVYGMTQEDLVGNSTGSPDAEFSVQILPPLPAPALFEPALGYHSLSDHTVHIRTENAPEGIMYVREGTTPLCASTPVAVPTFECDTVPLSNGYHTISVFQRDQYGTLSAVTNRLVHIGPYPLALTSLNFSFHIIGPEGEVGIDGLSAGDPFTIEASGLPVGTLISAELHSTVTKLGSTTIGPSGKLSMPGTIPEIEAGDHEIVVNAEAPGFNPTTKASALTVRDVKVLGEPVAPPEEIKQLGDPENPDDTGTGVNGPGGGGSNGHGFGDPTVFGSSVVSPLNAPAHAFILSPAGIVLSGSIAIAFLLLVGFPAELLESTIRSNYDRAFGWLGRLRERVGRLVGPLRRILANPWIGTGISVAVAAWMLGFADPDYGLNGASVRLFLAMVISVATINIGLSLIVMRVARRSFDVGAVLRPMPAAIALVALSVAVSRLAGISPGFLFGVVLGVTYLRELKLRDEARLGVLTVGLTIAAGVLAWLGYGLASLASGPGFFNNLLIEVLAAITLEALGTLVVALLPIEFMDGRTIFRWSKLAWLGLYVLTLAVFLFVVVPLSDNWGTMSAPIFGWGTLFAVFAVVAVATWAIFQRRPKTSSREDAAPRRRSRR